MPAAANSTETPPASSVGRADLCTIRCSPAAAAAAVASPGSPTSPITSLLLRRDVKIHETTERLCFLCGADDDGRCSDCPPVGGDGGGPLQLCSHCGLVWYCCQDHLEIHRVDGKCFPFIIKRSTEGKGRFMVATRDIDPLELILIEDPAVVGPYSKSMNGCLQCFKKVDGSFCCPGCRFPMCDERCAGGARHADECDFFSKAHELTDQKQQQTQEEGGPAVSNGRRRPNGKRLHLSALALNSPRTSSASTSRAGTSTTPVTSHVCVTPLRMLLKKKSDPKTFAKINMLMDHAEERAAVQKSINFQLAKVILLLKESGYISDFNQHDIHRMIGILRTNGMKLESQSGTPGVALYPVYCLINHACYNNTNYVKFPDLRLELRAQLPIRKGEEIFTRYISSTIGNVRRRSDILKYWFFDCTCERCSDRTEFGTYMSSLRCTACLVGFLLPADALDYNSDWECGNCSVVVPFRTVDDVLATLEKQESQIGDVESAQIGELEELLFHYQDLLHPNHYILVDIMHNLVHVYAAKANLTRPEKERKVQLCTKVLDVLTRVDAGYTIWRGTLIQEMIHPLMMISKEDHNSGRISDKEFRRRLALCSKKLKEAKLCLRGGFTPAEDYIRRKAASSPLRPHHNGKDKGAVKAEE